MRAGGSGPSAAGPDRRACRVSPGPAGQLPTEAEADGTHTRTPSTITQTPPDGEGDGVG